MKLNIKKIICLGLGAISLLFFLNATLKYLSYESAIHEGLTSPKVFTLEQYKLLSDLEKLDNHVTEINYSMIHEFDKLSFLLMILFFLVSCLFIYLGINVKNSEK